MSSETIVTALFLIAAVVAAGVLINAVFPIISRTTETFGSVAHSTDDQIRTDIKIVNYFAKTPAAEIWLKNIGSSRISVNDLDNSDVFIGGVGNFDRSSLQGLYNKTAIGQWWDPGETLDVTLASSKIPAAGGMAYFAIVLPNGVKRSVEFVTD
jgi:archaeal flagellar protein FlaG